MLVAIQNTLQPSMTIILKDLMYTPLLLGRQKLFSFQSSSLWGRQGLATNYFYFVYCTKIYFKKSALNKFKNLARCTFIPVRFINFSVHFYYLTSVKCHFFMMALIMC